jgi:hypothetical protein
MKRIVFLFLVPLLITGCQAQSDKKAEKEGSGISENRITQNVEPKVDIKVNKKYDEQGNLIGYDSTYTWSYSTIQGDSANVNADSVFSEFRPLFDEHFPDFNNSLRYGMFDLDSLFYHDFLSHDYFYDWWHRDLMEQEKTFRRMDSLKNEFFNRHYPGLLKP